MRCFVTRGLRALHTCSNPTQQWSIPSGHRPICWGPPLDSASTFPIVIDSSVLRINPINFRIDLSCTVCKYLSTLAQILNSRIYMPVVYVCRGAFPLLQSWGWPSCALSVLMCVGGNWGHCYYTVLQRTPRMKQRLQPKATWVDVLEHACVCVCVYIVVFYCWVSAAHMCVQALNFSFQIFIQFHRGLRGGFQSPDEKGGCGCRSVAL